MLDRSRAAHTVVNKTDPTIEAAILGIRERLERRDLVFLEKALTIPEKLLTIMVDGGTLVHISTIAISLSHAHDESSVFPLVNMLFGWALPWIGSLTFDL